MALNLADMIEHTIDAVPERTALESGDRTVTYARLEERANRLAHHLIARGVRPGDTVGIHSRNSIECIEAMVAILKARAVMVNVNYRYTADELDYLFSDSDICALIHEARYSAAVAQVAPRCPALHTIITVADGSGAAPPPGALDYEEVLAGADAGRDFGDRSADDVFIIYTGGTTGMPKGVMWRHEDVWRVLGGGISITTGEYLADEWTQSRQAAASPQLTRYPLPPFIHGGSQWAIITGLLTGGRAVLYPEFDAAGTWEMVQRHRANVLFIVGDAMARPMLDALRARRRSAEPDYDLSSLKAITSSAVQFSSDLKREYAAELPGVVITDSIGSSETGFSGVARVGASDAYSPGPRVRADASTSVLREDGTPVRPGSGEVGMIARSGHIPLGYYNDPDKTARTFRTLDGVRYAIPGDYARVESDGTVTMLGRGSATINTGGEKVHSEEVEAALKSHPRVRDALVVGVADQVMGQAVAAIVEPEPGARPDLTDLDAHARAYVAGYKVPRAAWFVEAIRRSPAGKPDYRWAHSVTAEREPDAASERFRPSDTARPR